MITAITLENFKGIREPVRIELAPLTLLFGPNNAGKSTIIQALIYAREIFERGDTDPRHTVMGGDTLDLGGFDSLVHGRDRSRAIRMRFELAALEANQWEKVGYDLESRYSELLPPDCAEWPYDLSWNESWLAEKDTARFWEDPEFPDLQGNYEQIPEANFGHYFGYDSRIRWQPPNFADFVRLSAGRLWVELVISFNTVLKRPMVTAFHVGSADNSDIRIECGFDPTSGIQYLSHLSLGFIPFGTAAAAEEIPNAVCSALSRRCGVPPNNFREDVRISPIAPEGPYSILLSTQATLALMGYPHGQLGQAIAAHRAANGALPEIGARDWTHWIDIRPAGRQSDDQGATPSHRDQEEVRPDWASITGSRILTPIVQTLVRAAGDHVDEAIKYSTYLSSHRTMPDRRVGLPWRGPIIPGVDESPRNGSDAAWQALMRDDGYLIQTVNDWLSAPLRFNAGVRLTSRSLKIAESNGEFGTLLQKLGQSGADLESAAFTTEQVNRLLRCWKALPTQIEIWFARFGRHGDLIKVPLQDMGAGMAHLIPVLVAAHRPMSRDAIVAIEEPEAKVHSAFQVVLADLFLTQASANPGVIFLVETHSEHLMLRCLRRIRETAEGSLPEGIPAVKPEDLAVLFVEPDEDGQPRIHRIRIDETGEFLDPWPRGFFRERAKELFG